MTEKKETKNQHRSFLERNNRKNNCKLWRCNRTSKIKMNKMVQVYLQNYQQNFMKE